MSSINYRLGVPGRAPYSATKAGILGLTTGLSRELGREGIRVNTVSPGWVFTERQVHEYFDGSQASRHLEYLAERPSVPLKISSGDIANPILFDLSEVSRASTGHNCVVDAGWLLESPAARTEAPMIRYDARVLLRPPTPELRFLPEGPYPCDPGLLSWVAIQHGATAIRGSLNLLDVSSGSHRSFPLPGRPGFAFPTSDRDTFLVGCEKRVGFFDLDRAEWVGPSVTVESDVGGTILNDAVFHGDAVIFGTKDLAFQTPRAGLYFWRPSRDRLVRLAAEQVCSNGKVVLEDDEGARLLDIDTPTRQVVEYPLDLEEGTVGAPGVVLDLTNDPAYPDGMILTPDGRGVVIAFYHPDSVEAGEARQYDLASGAVQVLWRTEGSPQVTCPQWLSLDGRVALVLTTAVEHMAPERLARCPNAGALFVAETPWSEMPEVPRFPLPQGPPFAGVQ